jgi:hypothetical protein
MISLPFNKSHQSQLTYACWDCFIESVSNKVVIRLNAFTSTNCITALITKMTGNNAFNIFCFRMLILQFISNELSQQAKIFKRMSFPLGVAIMFVSAFLCHCEDRIYLTRNPSLQAACLRAPFPGRLEPWLI